MNLQCKWRQEWFWTLNFLVKHCSTILLVTCPRPPEARFSIGVMRSFFVKHEHHHCVAAASLHSSVFAIYFYIIPLQVIIMIIIIVIDLVSIIHSYCNTQERVVTICIFCMLNFCWRIIAKFQAISIFKRFVNRTLILKRFSRQCDVFRINGANLKLLYCLSWILVQCFKIVQ